MNLSGGAFFLVHNTYVFHIVLSHIVPWSVVCGISYEMGILPVSNKKKLLHFHSINEIIAKLQIRFYSSESICFSGANEDFYKWLCPSVSHIF